jgi:arsenite oxidase small subunit
MAEEARPDEPPDDGSGGLTRRNVLIGGGVAVAGGAVAAVVVATSDDDDEGGDGGDGYPRKRIAGTGDLKPGNPISFEYPLDGQASVLLDTGEEVPGGVGDNSSVVAYSILCQHMGCPVAYRADEKDFLCGCHQSRYDPAREGVVIQGVSQRPLPRIALEIDGEDIYATGVDGLIYGYRSNLENGRRAA